MTTLYKRPCRHSVTSTVTSTSTPSTTSLIIPLALLTTPSAYSTTSSQEPIESIKCVILTYLTIRSHLNLGISSKSWYKASKRPESKNSCASYMIRCNTEQEVFDTWISGIMSFRPHHLSFRGCGYNLQLNHRHHQFLSHPNLKSLELFYDPIMTVENDTQDIKVSYPNIQSLFVYALNDVNLLKQFPNLTSLSLYYNYSRRGIIDILHNLPSLTHFSSDPLGYKSMCGLLSHPSLTSLKDIFNDMNPLSFNNVVIRLSAHQQRVYRQNSNVLLRLTRLQLNGCSIGLFKAIMDATPNLTNLRFTSVNYDIVHMTPFITLLKEKTSLDDLHLIFDYPQQVEILSLLPQLSNKLHGLSFKWSNLHLFNYSVTDISFPLDKLTLLTYFSLSGFEDDPCLTLKGDFINHPQLSSIMIQGDWKATERWLPWLDNLLTKSLGLVPETMLEKKNITQDKVETFMKAYSTYLCQFRSLSFRFTDPSSYISPTIQKHHFDHVINTPNDICGDGIYHY